MKQIQSMLLTCTVWLRYGNVYVELAHPTLRIAIHNLANYMQTAFLPYDGAYEPLNDSILHKASHNQENYKEKSCHLL